MQLYEPACFRMTVGLAAGSIFAAGLSPAPTSMPLACPRRLLYALALAISVTCGATTAGIAQPTARSCDRLFLPDSTLTQLRESVALDSGFLATYYRQIHRRARGYLLLPDATRDFEGRRMLGVSRDMLRVLSDAALIVLVEDDGRYLDFVDRQLMSLARFEDWNPSHFLDVAEMSLAVSVALDWVGERLPPKHRAMVEEALARNVLVEVEDEAKDYWWLDSETNWNQVCLTGVLAAAYVLEERFPNTAQEALDLALDHMDYGLAAYAPDGVYPEGVSYWVYGTSYSALGIELLRRWRGDSFGLEHEDGFLASARFASAAMGPRGQAYDFGDGYLTGVHGGYGTLAWFAVELDDRSLLSKPGLLREAATKSPAGRLAALRIPWIAAAERLPPSRTEAAEVFVGDGINPVALVRSPVESSFFLGIKGGSADINHGQMDAGSFVYELDGVRWALDAGVRGYQRFEAAGIDLWSFAQDSERWQLVDKNELGHSTVRIDGQRHRASGYAPLRRDEATGAILVAMDSVLGAPVREWTRSWLAGEAGFRLRDEFVLDSAGTAVWQWLTDVRLARRREGELILRSVARGPDARMSSPGGRAITLRLTDPDQRFEVVPMRPGSDPYGLDWPGLKRIEVHVDGQPGERGVIEVEVGRWEAAGGGGSR